LEVLGDGMQDKSYIHLDDCIEGILVALEEFLASDSEDPVNVGNDDGSSAMEIARVVAGEMLLKEVSIEPGGGSRRWSQIAGRC